MLLVVGLVVALLGLAKRPMRLGGVDKPLVGVVILMDSPIADSGERVGVWRTKGNDFLPITGGSASNRPLLGSMLEK